AVRNGRSLVFTGMGGSYDACYAPVTALASVGITGVMVDSAELLYFRRPTQAGRTLLVMVSQSGESAEVVRLIEQLDGEPERPFTVSITNGLDNTLARLANVALDSRAGHEQGPSSMTFGAALVVLAALADVLAGRPVEEALARGDLEAGFAGDPVGRHAIRGRAGRRRRRRIASRLRCRTGARRRNDLAGVGGSRPGVGTGPRSDPAAGLAAGR